MARWRNAIRVAERVKLPFDTPDWDRLRNYEIENRMTGQFGGRWVVSEWCPFNGIHCRWADYAPIKVLQEQLAAFDGSRRALTEEGYNVDFLISLMQRQIDKRRGKKKSSHENHQEGAPII